MSATNIVLYGTEGTKPYLLSLLKEFLDVNVTDDLWTLYNDIESRDYKINDCTSICPNQEQNIGKMLEILDQNKEIKSGIFMVDMSEFIKMKEQPWYISWYQQYKIEQDDKLIMLVSEFLKKVMEKLNCVYLLITNNTSVPTEYFDQITHKISDNGFPNDRCILIEKNSDDKVNLKTIESLLSMLATMEYFTKFI